MENRDYEILQELQTLAENLGAYNIQQSMTSHLNLSEIRETMQWYVDQITRLQEKFSLEAQEQFADTINNIVETAILIQNIAEKGKQ